jgi:hypothetical protein
MKQSQHLLPQLATLQQVVKAQDGALVGEPLLPGELRELAKPQLIMQRELHRQVAQRELPLHKVTARHGLQVKERSALPALRRVRIAQRIEFGPRPHAFLLRRKLALAGSLGTQVQSQVDCCIVRIVTRRSSPSKQS